MAYEMVITDVSDYVGLIKVNRPDALNALNAQLLDELSDVLAAWDRDEDVRAIVMISALVLTPEEQAGFEAQFQPVPLDEAGTRFSKMWAASVQHRGPGVSLEDLAASFAENLRAGEAYEWGHGAAFAYNAHFPKRVSELAHPITVLNPGDMLFELTPRVAPLLKNGKVVDHPEWGFGFMDSDTDGAARAVLEALA